jgi:hypothetical protein
MIHVYSNSARSSTSRFQTLGAVGTPYRAQLVAHYPIDGYDSLTMPEADRT